MAKSQKELAFLRELYLQDDWTRRFAELVDKHIDLSDSENLLYINAGTGGHAIALAERFGEKVDVFASVENEDLLNIARDKAAAVSSNVDFSMLNFEEDSFDAVLVDASLLAPSEIEAAIANATRVARTGADIAVIAPSSGSYGEVFSLMWEVLASDDMDGDGAVVESLISELPGVSRLEEFAAAAGLVNVHTESVAELFEFENGQEFVESPLVADFLMPSWLGDDDDEKNERVNKQLAQLIDAEDGDISFIFSVKATLLSAEKG